MTDVPSKHRIAGQRTLFIAIAVAGIVLDRITKIAVSSMLATGQAMPFLPGVMDILLVYNTGAAWGMLEGAFWFFLLIALGVTAGVTVYVFKAKNHTWFEIAALGLIVAGALGNLYDRVFYGRVVDFFHTLFIDFPVFNVADSCITVGVIMLAVFFIFSPNSPFSEKPGEGKEEEEENEGDARR